MMAKNLLASYRFIVDFDAGTSLHFLLSFGSAQACHFDRQGTIGRICVPQRKKLIGLRFCGFLYLSHDRNKFTILVVGKAAIHLFISRL